MKIIQLNFLNIIEEMKADKILSVISLYIPILLVIWEIFLSIVILIKIPCKFLYNKLSII